MKSFLSLVRLGIGHSASIPTHVDWVTTEALAAEQGLSAIVLDGIEELPLNKRPPQELLLQWIGEVLGFYENNYVEYEKAIGQLAHFYNKYGFQMMVIKGYGLSLNYPKPSHRPCGDIDIWLFGKQKDADATAKLRRMTAPFILRRLKADVLKDLQVQDRFLYVPETFRCFSAVSL